MHQTAIAFSPAVDPGSLHALDLFAGTGGLSLGFLKGGFAISGVDSEIASHRVFDQNAIGDHQVLDLHVASAYGRPTVIIGGPPCRPWSAVNMKRRGAAHGDHALVKRFFEHLAGARPLAFLMENVPPLRSDPTYMMLVDWMRLQGYSVGAQILQYSNFGAATTRRRLFTVGFACDTGLASEDFFHRLDTYRRPAGTVREAIGWLVDSARGSVPDHEWSGVTTIGRYAERYRTGKFGWKRLSWDEPAPSFGSVSKTYILHPDSNPDDPAARVISVREVLCLMGFSRTFRFPPSAGLSIRYGMAANAVSPLVSRACAGVLRTMLTGEDLDPHVGHSTPAFSSKAAVGNCEAIQTHEGDTHAA